MKKRSIFKIKNEVILLHAIKIKEFIKKVMSIDFLYNFIINN